MDIFSVNRGNTAIKVTDTLDDSKQIGTIYPNEVCTRWGGEQNYYVNFLASDGKIKGGSIVTDPNLDNIHYFTDGSGYNVPGAPNGYVYKMRRTMNVYRADGSYWGRVAGGMYIVTTDPSCGDTHKDWMKVNYVQSTRGEWVKVEGAGYGHGFVDTGFGSASGYNSWAIDANV